jgi:undecaprenyl-diphosphatase
MNIIRSAIDKLGSRGVLVLLAVLVVVGGAYSFIELTDDVTEGDTLTFDDTVISWLRDHQGPRWLQIMGRDITGLGGLIVLTGLTAVVAGYFLLRRKYQLAIVVLVATAGGSAINTGLKHLIGRERPPVEYRIVQEVTHSFPSGHAMLAATVYLTLGTLLARGVPGRALKAYILFIAVIVTILVGLSRVYLMVHWPTDVLAGWTAGLIWAVLLWLGVQVLQRRRLIERDTDGDGDIDAEDDNSAPGR